MTLAPGVRVGPYEVTALIGEGGMGKVWRAHHTALKRDDALKVLPDAFASDPDRLARFRREAQVLASLNHPNIARVYGLEQSDGVQALVMELVEGPTLGDRIAQGPIPVAEALPIAKQIAEALEAAHEQGIIHRDLKPANIKLRPDGTVKVLDFGLAKALEPASGAGVDATASPTITSPAMMTSVGTLLGTAAYMSPEQAKGRSADKRSDVWAFGAVLFEMLTGRRPFGGTEVYEVLASVLAREPDWTLLPPRLSPAVATYLKRCLHKDPKQRIADMQSVRLALEGVFEASTDASAGTSTARAHARIGWQGALSWALAGVLAGSLLIWAVMRRDPAPSESVTRFAVPLADNESLTGIGRHLVAVSPNGTHVAYTANEGLSLRPLNQLQATPIPGTDGAREPFFASDGQWIGFFAGGELKRVSVSGGAPVTLGATAMPWGASWGADGMILVGQGPKGIVRMPAAGGTPEMLIPVENGELAGSPQMLPGGEWVLFTLRPVGVSQWDQAQIVVQSVATRKRTVLIEGGREGTYLPTGHLVYARGEQLLAVPFDLGARRVTGGPVPLVQDLASVSNFGAAQFSVAGNGSLVYLPIGANPQAARRTLVWVDRQGRETPLAVSPRGYVYPRVSPDGTRVALDVRDPAADIWIWDLGRETLTRLTFDPGADRSPAWFPDGRRIAFSSQRDGSAGNLFSQSADGTGTAERLAEAARDVFPTSVSPDGSQILINVATGGATGAQAENDDIAVVSREGREMPLLATMFGERNAEVSPDGRWMAYESDESGREEVYVRPFPDVQGGRWQVSTGGGRQPVWARSGRELFYLVPPGRIMSVLIQPGASFVAGNPQLVVNGPYIAPNAGRTYDVSQKGDRFLMIKDAASSDKTSAPPSIIVVQGWFEELKRRVPVN
jgi:eukaryotic-like serine/threonine-protein kinase